MELKRLVLTLSCLCALAISPIAPQLRAQSMPMRVEIGAKKFAFSPAAITLRKGVPVTLVLKSQDVAHGLRIRDLDVNVKAKAGQIAEVTFTPARTGTFIGECSIFCGEEHGSMTIKVVVVA